MSALIGESDFSLLFDRTGDACFTVVSVDVVFAGASDKPSLAGTAIWLLFCFFGESIRSCPTGISATVFFGEDGLAVGESDDFLGESILVLEGDALSLAGEFVVSL
jgi:hypothetical protein